MVKMLKSMVIIFGLLSLATLSTNSYYASRAIVSGNTFSAGTWEIKPPQVAKVVINEVYFSPDESHRVNEQAGKNEWIELYNPTTSDINIKDWQIQTDNYSRTINANKVVPAGSYLLLTHDGSTWTFWTLPTGINWADLGTAPNDYMRNNDSIKLKDSGGNIIDQFDYSNGQEGHSFERNPVGSSTIVDQVTPTPGS